SLFENPRHAYTKKLLAAVPVPDPSRRGITRNMGAEELKSPIRPLGYIPPRREYREVGAGHLVQVS
ncbi:MAG TPA: ABC transporter ATP-binding protein, partial [Dongiaceae bacterium]|nr:ABC transporter ATP-binding protein [Dongiaceae bacterium]